MGKALFCCRGPPLFSIAEGRVRARYERDKREASITRVEGVPGKAFSVHPELFGCSQGGNGRRAGAADAVRELKHL